VPLARCRGCEAAIVDYTSVIEIRGRLYCCRNCRLVSTGKRESGSFSWQACARCEAPILDPFTLVERQAQSFCCYNCAAAVTATDPPATRLLVRS
jgi:hypothetical protein